MKALPTFRVAALLAVLFSFVRSTQASSPETDAERQLALEYVAQHATPTTGKPSLHLFVCEKRGDAPFETVHAITVPLQDKKSEAEIGTSTTLPRGKITVDASKFRDQRLLEIGGELTIQGFVPPNASMIPTRKIGFQTVVKAGRPQIIGGRLATTRRFAGEATTRSMYVVALVN